MNFIFNLFIYKRNERTSILHDVHYQIGNSWEQLNKNLIKLI